MTTFLSTDGSINVKAVRADKHVITRGSPGVDAWALYGEIDVHNSTSPEAVATLRFLAAGEHLFYQLKWASRRAAGWKHSVVPEDELARRLLFALPAAFDYSLRGPIITTQLVATDVESILRKEAPQGRYTAKTAYEKLYGEGA